MSELRECRVCGASYEPGVEIDPCIGEPIPGAFSACCGHGNADHAYVLLGTPVTDVTKLQGQAALELIAEHRS